jgi:hypothetical protein
VISTGGTAAIGTVAISGGTGAAFTATAPCTATNAPASLAGTTCTAAAASGSITLTATLTLNTASYVIWGGACAGLTETVGIGTSAVTVNVPATGAIVTLPRLSQILMYMISQLHFLRDHWDLAVASILVIPQ